MDEVISDTNIPAQERAVLEKARPLFEAYLQVQRDQKELELDIKAVEADLKRLRDAASALSEKDSGAAIAERLLQRHDELRALEAKKRSLEQRLESRSAELQSTLNGLEAFREAILEERKKLQKRKQGPREQCPSDYLRRLDGRTFPGPMS